MKLEQSFEVTAPLERVWEALIDVERVAPCLPGAEVTGRNEDGSYDGTFKVKIGPTAAAYSGKLHMDEIDEGSHTATMHAQGTDRRGQGGAKATIVSSVAPAGDGATRVEVVTDYHITGRLARFGRGGMIEEISNRLLNEFAKSLQQMVAGDGPAAPPTTAPAAGEPAAAPAGAAEPAAAAEPAVSEAAASAVQPAAAAPAPAPDAAAAEPAAPQPAAGSSNETPFPRDTPPPASSGGSEPIQGLSLVGSVAWSRVKSNPAPLVALVIGFLVALRVLRRR
jgi:carbon monoxide dehydrogenase subunit G